MLRRRATRTSRAGVSLVGAATVAQLDRRVSGGSGPLPAEQQAHHQASAALPKVTTFNRWGGDVDRVLERGVGSGALSFFLCRPEDDLPVRRSLTRAGTLSSAISAR